MRRSRWGRVVLTLAALTLVVLLADLAGAPLGPLRGAGTAVLGPAERLLAPGADEDGAERARLADRVRALEDERDTAAQLDELLGSAVADGRELLPGRVVGVRRGGASGPQRVTLDLGRRDGVRRDSAVVAADGLVGRVVDVGDWTSDVEVLGSSRAEVGVRVGPEGVLGALAGGDPTTDRSAGELVVTALARDRVAAGDTVRTLGSTDGRPYPAGIPVGEVVTVADRQGRLTDTATVRPAVDLATLDVVGVVVAAPREDPRSPAGSGS